MALIGYARVSTRDQHEESQEDLLQEAGCERIFVDKVSGRLAQRPDWDRCLEYLRAGDTLVITRLSRMARSVRNLTEMSAWLKEHEVELLVLKQHIDTRTPAGRLMFHILGAVDEFQADLIRENTLEGLAAARARGRKGGRRPALSDMQKTEARRMYDSRSYTIKQIADALRCSPATIYRALDEKKLAQ